MHHALTTWFTEHVGEPYGFQRAAWEAHAAGESGLIHVPTGAGKTYAAYLPALSEAIEGKSRGLRVLYISPLRAMSRDLAAALTAPVEDLDLDVDVETRTGDTSSSVRRRQRKSLPNVLVTTPESLSLLMSYANAERLLGGVKTVIVDEWHELVHTKRGTQVELGLARLRRWAPELKTWALTATLSNVDEAAEAAAGRGSAPTIIRADLERPIHVETAIPEHIDAFPWHGNLGLKMLPAVLDTIERGRSTLVFTNTRSQAEQWFHAILEAHPELAGAIGLHHGSIDRKQRAFVEQGLKSGEFEVVVATSSLDLGVDFSPVDRVVQIGSVKGIARLIQRAGRSGHRPGAACRVLCVPTNALQLFEFAAARRAVHAGELEPRRSMQKPLDVLAQHLVTCALGGGFEADALFDEVRESVAYAELTRAEFDAALALVEHGGETLKNYDFFQRVDHVDGRYVVESQRVARHHRSSIGTITSDPSVQLRYTNNKRLGTVEESFISRVKKGDRFVFAGRVLELVHFRDLKAYVRRVDGSPTRVPRWMGGRLPISTSLASALRHTLEQVRDDRLDTPELVAARPLIDAQRELSALPGAGTLLVERMESREGHHLFLYPFEGRLVHEGLAALFALRLGRVERGTYTLSANEYGVELLSPEPIPFERAVEAGLFDTANLLDDVRESINVGELAKRQFRSVARVAGLVFDGYPGSRKTNRQLQASAGLLYDVFDRYDPDNLLLDQSRKEVLELHFEQTRLADTLRRLADAELQVVDVPRPTPLGFPLLVERTAAQLSTESLRERIERMKRKWMQVD
ncbi:ligase-associated DNA damage response DEXH box helicase [Persicimonas caeni]|uniref:Ligase-associated DNA damage response DEXH box helicase n=1 Tax=Persicimonas caeni TaxID=2292766 RepID=A0A4Y6PMS5_PERCE|nr:ligase-associated DNA damage response DEXH box helicase [Persicimonas caeni]QDG49529.1 ligase-associated DNA damage response DEXH box helicase [Persicimonas caeni]QED30750.1 ligase-associated DNA damage response DEXH box helicase [Persicimonas caeni]